MYLSEQFSSSLHIRSRSVNLEFDQQVPDCRHADTPDLVPIEVNDSIIQSNRADFQKLAATMKTSITAVLGLLCRGGK